MATTGNPRGSAPPTTPGAIPWAPEIGSGGLVSMSPTLLGARDTPPPLPWQAPSVVGRLVIASIAIQFTIAVAQYWPSAFLYPLNFFVPALLVHLVYSRWLRPAAAVPADSPVGTTDDLVVRFFGGMWGPGIFIALFLNTFVSYILQEIIYSSIQWGVALQGDNADINDFKSGITAGVILYIFLLSSVVAPVVEESLKYGVVRAVLLSPACCTQVPREEAAAGLTAQQRVSRTMAFCFASALAFGTAENVWYMFGHAGLVDQIVSVLIRSLLCTPGHVMYGLFTALRLCIRDTQLEARERGDTSVEVWSLPWVLAPAMVAHGVYNFFAFFGSWGMLLGFAVDAVAYVILSRQYADALPSLQRGELPPAPAFACGATSACSLSCTSQTWCLPCWDDRWCLGVCAGAKSSLPSESTPPPPGPLRTFAAGAYEAPRPLHGGEGAGAPYVGEGQPVWAGAYVDEARPSQPPPVNLAAQAVC